MIEGVGLDIGTNMLVSASIDDSGSVSYKKQRDAFYRIKPKSDIHSKSIKHYLNSSNCNYMVENNEFIIIGEEALRMANDRNDNAKRPMSKGVISASEKSSIPMLKVLLENIIGKGDSTPLVFSIPAEPVTDKFDIFFHKNMLEGYIKELGFVPESMNEAFAIAYSELLDDGLSGLTLSFGAGMVNICLCYNGDPISEFSITRGGDWIDTQVGYAVDENPSFIQIEKEYDGGVDLINPINNLHNAISMYYKVLVDYVIDVMSVKFEKYNLPYFREPLPIVLSGGLSLAKGFDLIFEDSLSRTKLPFEVSGVRLAKDPMTAVAHGCLMAAIL